MTTVMANSVLLNYHDTILRQSDVEILHTNGWLTDSVIGFYFQYLEKEVYVNNDFLFISPEVTQCIKSSHHEEIPIFLDPLDAKRALVIFFPVNNNERVNMAGGSHWSLLVYFRSDRTFYHFDSMNNVNHSQAAKLAFKLQHYLNKNSPASLKEEDSLQQNNHYDCGIYLICNVDNITKHVSIFRRFDDLPVIKRDDVNLKRANLSSLIYTLRNRSTSSD